MYGYMTQIFAQKTEKPIKQEQNRNDIGIGVVKYLVGVKNVSVNFRSGK